MSSKQLHKLPKLKHTNFLFAYLFFVVLIITIFIFTYPKPEHKIQLSSVDTADAASVVVLQEGFESAFTSNWLFTSPSTNISTVAGAGINGTKGLVVTNPGPNTTTVATYRFAVPSDAKVGVMMYDDMSTAQSYRYLSLTDDTFTRGMSIGIRPQTSANNYVYCPTIDKNGCMDTGKKRTLGWHNFKIILSPKGAYGKIDGESFSYLPANEINAAVNVNFPNFQRINLGMQFIAGKSTYDDLYVDTFPAPGTGTDIAYNMINIFLNSYQAINVTAMDQMMKARKSEFCAVDFDPHFNQSCPDGTAKRPNWIYYDQLFHMYTGLLNTAKAHIIRYDKTGNQADLDKAISIIQYIDNDYWAQHRSAALISSSLNITAHLAWNKLSPTLKQSIENHLIADANTYLTQLRPQSKYIGDSGGEENVWPAAYFTTMALTFYDRPEAKTYLDRGRFFAFHSLTRGESYGGVTTRTIYDDYLLDNHDYHPHPGYVTSVVQPLAYIDLLTKRVTGVSYPEYTHNVKAVWDANKNYIDAKSFQYRGSDIIRRGVDVNPVDGIPDYFPQGNVFWPSGKSDWGTDALLMSQFRLLKESVGDNSWNDISAQFSTTDVTRHAEESVYYLKSGYVWRYAPANVQLAEMKLDNDLSLQPYPDSYVWYQNSGAVGDYVLYEYMFDPTVPFLQYLKPPVTPTPTPVPTPIPTPTRTPTPTPVPTAITTPTATPSPTPTPTPSPTPNHTPTPTPTPTRTPTPVPTPSPISYGCNNMNFFTVSNIVKDPVNHTNYAYTKECLKVPNIMYQDDPRFTFFIAPTTVANIPYVRTDNLGIKEDRNLSWSISLTQPSIVYVFYRKIPGQVAPTWLQSGFTKKTNDDYSNLNQFLLRKNDQGLIGVYDIYEKLPLFTVDNNGVSHGGVTLGPATDSQATAFSMYLVGIKPVQ